MMRHACLLLGLLALALPVSAAATVKVDLEPSSPSFSGDPITLHVYVTANAAEMDDTVFGRVRFDSTKVTLQSSQQFALPGAGWVTGLLSCNTVGCVAFNQINFTSPAAVNVTNFEIATLTFTTASLPENVLFPILFDWVTTPTSQRLDFFGVTSAPGVCITVMDGPACPIPEPGTAGLLALGLAALALACRRYS